MPEGITAENLLNNIVETLADTAPKQKSVSFFEDEKSNSVGAQFNRLFGRQKPVHSLLGGGKSADVLLWRNKKISAGFLAGATAIWVLFEWIDYNFLPLTCFVLMLGLIAQFVWSNASGFLNSSPSQVPCLVIPDELFINVAKSLGSEVNRGLGFLQDISCGGNVKQLLVVVASLLAAGMLASWCNFLTLLYIGFVAAHTLPVLYERYEDQVDNFVYNALDQLRQQYRKVDAGVLSKIPTRKKRE